WSWAPSSSRATSPETADWRHFPLRRPGRNAPVSRPASWLKPGHSFNIPQSQPAVSGTNRTGARSEIPMIIISQLVSGALALCLATAAFGVENEAPVRLRLALDEQGRVHLSTEPLQQVAPSLYPARQPSLAGLGSARVPTAAGTAIDFTMSSATGSVA